MKSLRAFLILSMLSLAAVWGGCDSTTTPGETITTSVRFFHAAPTNNGFDTVIEGTLAAGTVGFRQASEWVDVEVGRRDVDLTLPGVPTTLFGHFEPRFDEGISYLGFATGTSIALNLTFFEHNASAPSAGNTRVQVVHTLQNRGAMDLLVGPGGGDLEQFVVAGQDVSYLSMKESAEFPAGTYELVMVDAGTLNEQTTLSSYTFESGKSYTIVLFENSGGGPPFAIVPVADS